ncbi:MAG TPA: OsmC family protein [Nocardioidaceae bacterium]|nr:OsmC family protein [Nocardioidaceae bacterium]
MSGSAQRTVHAHWDEGMRAVVEAGRFDVVSDEPLSAGGSDTGPTPTDLFLASIASCFVLALVWAARRAGHELPGLQVRVVGTYAGPRFSRVEIEVSSDASGAVVDDLLPEAERVCYVTNSLRNPPEVHVERVAMSTPSPRNARSADGGRSP